MPPEDLERHLNARPFVPFRIKLTTGETYDVRHPELVMVGRRSVIVGITHDPIPRYERAVTVALVHIVRLEPLEAASASS
jgi:hypothetical protein